MIDPDLNMDTRPHNGHPESETPRFYQRKDVYCDDVTEDISGHVYEMLKTLGEDPEREGLVKTPERVAKAYQFLMQGYVTDPRTILESAVFEEDYSEMILVKDIEVFSLCVPSKQVVNAVTGAKRACDVGVGDQLWTLQQGRVVPTTVEQITSRKARALVEVETEKGTVRVTPDHPFATPEGWVEARDLQGKHVEWTPSKKLCRSRFRPQIGYDFVLNSLDTFQGFLDGYIDGDGFRCKYSKGHKICSANVPFLQEMADVVGARFTPKTPSVGSQLYIADSWLQKHGFLRETHQTDLVESRWVQVKRVTPLHAKGKKPYTVYSFKCNPHPTFLISGHLSHNCEHHILPFFGKAHVAYIPDGKIVGLSKIPRVVDVFARRLQVQERLTIQVRDAIQEVLNPLGVAVVIEATHLCMVMRGVQKQHSITTTSAMSGEFLNNPTTRTEFMRLINGS